MINIKFSFFLLLCASLLHGCFIEAPIRLYAIIFRNACGYDVEITVPSRLRGDYQRYFPKAYLDSDGIPVVNLKPEADIWLADRTTRGNYGENADFWQEVFPEDETFTIRANNNSRTLNKQQIIEFLKNNEAQHPRGDIPVWTIYDASLCP